MKKGRWIAPLLLALFLGGCTVGDTEIRFSTQQIQNTDTLFWVNGEKGSLSSARLYLCNYRSLYGSAYGVDLQYDEELEEYVKDVTLQELARIQCMVQLAGEEELALTEQETEKAASAAEAYYASLTEEERTYIGMDQTEIREAYEDYALAEKLYAQLTKGTDEEISDDEARVIRIRQIYVRDEQTMQTVAEKLAAGEDFATVAGVYSRSESTEETIARGELPEAVEEAAFDLDDGEISACIEADDGYYFVQCVSKYDEELTEENKEQIRIRRREERFTTEYEAFVDSAEFRLDSQLWDSVTLQGVEVETSSFFALYDTYFGTEGNG